MGVAILCQTNVHLKVEFFSNDEPPCSVPSTCAGVGGDNGEGPAGQTGLQQVR